MSVVWVGLFSCCPKYCSGTKLASSRSQPDRYCPGRQLRRDTRPAPTSRKVLWVHLESCSRAKHIQYSVTVQTSGGVEGITIHCGFVLSGWARLDFWGRIFGRRQFWRQVKVRMLTRNEARFKPDGGDRARGVGEYFCDSLVSFRKRREA